MVEVDASQTGMGAVLSQQQGSPARLHPCVLFSRKLSQAEQNCNTGNQELLIIKLTLEEWHHWLKGSRHHFLFITNQHNIEYLKKAQRLNPRQAKMDIIFHQFTISEILEFPALSHSQTDKPSNLPTQTPQYLLHTSQFPCVTITTSGAADGPSLPLLLDDGLTFLKTSLTPNVMEGALNICST